MGTYSYHGRNLRAPQKASAPSSDLQKPPSQILPKVLVVSTDPVVLEQAQEMLKTMNVEMACAGSGEDALSSLSRERFDLMMSDWVLPDMRGMDLLMAVRKDHRDLPIIIMASRTGMKNIDHCRKIGSTDYVSKPFDLYFLKAMVRQSIAKKRWSSRLVFASAKMSDLYSKALTVAKSNTNVCIYGESGTGKELIAKAIHEHSSRRARSLVTLACATIPEKLTDSMLFGYGYETNSPAAVEREGILQRAHKGTLFLDEVAELKLSSQARLLGVLEYCEFHDLKSFKPFKVDVQVVSTTNKNLNMLIEEGKFRRDLYYRLDVISLTVPPLRERREDIPLLIEFFLEKFNWEYGKNVRGINARTMDFFMNYDWPGNIRELENWLKRGVLLSDRDRVDIDELQLSKKHSGYVPGKIYDDLSVPLGQVEGKKNQPVVRTVRGHLPKTT
jgi:DNA-binding NtrC family response regulator